LVDKRLFKQTKVSKLGLGNLARVTDDKGNITQIWYDSLGRKLKMDDPDMGVWTYEYDKAGNLTKQTDAKGQVLEFEYDNLNRLTRKFVNPQTLVTYIYDDVTKQNCLGRLSEITDQSGSSEFFYDKLGREIKSTKSADGINYSIEREYDVLDRLTKLKYPDGEAVTYTYNPQGIEKVTGQQNYVSNIEYFCTGQIAKVVYGNGTETNYTYDPNTLRLNKLITQSPTGKIQDLDYQFDSVGNIKSIQDYVNTATQNFLYDDLNRLVQGNGSYGSFSYEYDSIGNMTSKEGINLSYGKNGRLAHAVSQFGSTAIDYDDNGNMIKKANTALSYDAENRLIKVEGTSASPPDAALQLTLTPGWNFISLPFIPEDQKISSVLSGIGGKYEQVSRYNSATQQFEHYVGNPKFDQFTDFEYGRGYQIYISGTEDVSLTITGIMPAATQS
ncbi:MAG: hypothetical protein COX41_01260, partial [Candidatus Omnitrophica bacterium CG23_combo_of_CG06-09_8_20_14_all_41_10]